MNDYLSVRGTRDFARVSPEELSRVQIARNGYHRKKRSAGTQIGTMISRYLCKGITSKCWECECIAQCEYGKRYMALLREREDKAGRPWRGYAEAIRPDVETYMRRAAAANAKRGESQRRRFERERRAKTDGQSEMHQAPVSAAAEVSP